LIITHKHVATGDYTQNPCSGHFECYGEWVLKKSRRLAG
jgi:hypothetical protein